MPFLSLRACVSSIAESELERIKQQAPNNVFKIDFSPYFQIQLANGQLEKPMQQPHSDLILEIIR